MITLDLDRTRAARRAAALSRSEAIAPMSEFACMKLPPQTAPFDAARRRRVQIIVLMVALAHSVVVLTHWRALMRNTASAPRALQMQFDVQAFTPGRAPTTPEEAVSTHLRAAAPSAQSRSPAPPMAAPPPRKMEMRRSEPAPAQASHMPRPASTQSSPFTPSPPETQADAGHASDPAPKPLSKTPDDMDKPIETITAPSFNASYLHNPPPHYPAEAQQRHWQGTVLLSVHVQTDGKPDHVELASSSGHAPLDDAAVEAVEDWRFVPARRGDVAIDGWIKVPIEFKLEI